MNHEQLYQLLPEIYRLRDLQQGQPLRALMLVLEEQLQTITADIDALYNNWFIETCDEWVIPYIAELLSIDPTLFELAVPLSRRNLVMHTLAGRQHKGTATALAGVACDLTGWTVCVEEAVPLVGRTHSLRQPHQQTSRSFDLRRNRSFQTSPGQVSHTAHLRTNAPGQLSAGMPYRGIQHPANVSLLLWRQNSYPRQRANARRVLPSGYTFHPYGIDQPLFTPDHPLDAQTNPEAAPIPLIVPALQQWLGQLGTTAPHADFDSGLPFVVRSRATPTSEWETLAAEQFLVADLATWQLAKVPDGLLVRAALDPQRGRLLLLDQPEPAEVEVSYCYGFSLDIGGGPYLRRPRLPQTVWQATVAALPGPFGASLHTERLTQALDDWQQADSSGTILLLDNRSYPLSADGQPRRITLAAHQTLVLAAAEGVCPCLIGDLTVVALGPCASLVLDGLWIDGSISVAGPLSLQINHCTLHPFHATLRPSITAARDAPLDQLELCLDSCISGPIRLPANVLGLIARDSIIDGGAAQAVAGPGDQLGYGPLTQLEHCTILGDLRVWRIASALGSIFTGQTFVQHTDDGLLSHCYVAPGSVTPALQHCQPDQALHEAEQADQPGTRLRVQPLLRSLIYGQPDYAQLSINNPNEIWTGAEDGSELGASHQLYQMRRLQILQRGLDEHFPYYLRPLIRFCS